MDRKATALWKGTIKEGNGTVSTKSRVLNETPYSFKDRFENGKGTNPEELLAASHAGCFAMALAYELGKVDIIPKKIDTNVAISLDETKEGFAIGKSHIDVKAHIEGAEEEKFQKAVEAAKKSCLISKVLKIEISLEAKMVSS